jgi:hypothetical protein
MPKGADLPGWNEGLAWQAMSGLMRKCPISQGGHFQRRKCLTVKARSGFGSGEWTESNRLWKVEPGTSF